MNCPLRHLLFGSSLFCLAQASQAQFSAARQLSNTVPGASGIVAADLDGDGNMDLLVASQLDDRISWFAGDGTGSFGHQNMIAEELPSTSGTRLRDAYRVLAVDLDLDGDMDVVSAHRASGELRLFENLGAGQFGTAQVLNSFLGGLVDLAYGDLNGDGYPDLVSASTNQDRIAWIRNKQNLNFSGLKVLVGANRGASGVETGDLDGDGLVDVVASSAVDGRLVWFRNLGASKFDPEQVIADHGSGTRDVALGDLDGDGDLDLVSSGNQNYLYTNVGGGAFVEALLSSAGGNRIAMADLDGDAELDVAIVSGLANGSIQLFKNSTVGLGPAQSLAGDLGDFPQDADLAMADFDGDSKPDMVSVAEGLPELFVNQGGSLVLADPIFVGNHMPRTSGAGDLNGDGVNDIVMASDLDGNLSWFQGLGGGAFADAQLLGKQVGVRQIIVRDFNNDGFDDVATRSFFFGGQLLMYYGGPSGQFTRHVLPFTGRIISDMAAGDVDGDGLVDLVVVAGYFQRRTLLLYKLPGLRFKEPTIINPGNGFPTVVELLDVNGDGRLDLLASSLNGLDWLRNRGPRVSGTSGKLAGNAFVGGIFAAPITINPTPQVHNDLLSEDFDGDGISDLLISVRGLAPPGILDELCFYKGTGQGNFEEQAPIPISGMSNFDISLNLQAADFDHDGLMDFALCTELEPTTVYINLGSGQFDSSLQVAPEVLGSTALALADYDGDGALDMAFACGISSIHEARDLIYLALNEFPLVDCDGNGILDSADIASGTATDFNADGIPDTCLNPALYADTFSLNANLGGSQNFSLDAGALNAGEAYVLLGSLNGTSPGTNLGFGILPLNQDSYFNLTLNSPGAGPLAQSTGNLDSNGRANASLIAPPGAALSLIGLQANHAFFVISASNVPFISNALPLSFF